ncbi:hypothetical protein E1286_06090 [Nonomuraea terrae]|uniref:BA14K family protein n=1 Tax=Nonomuraea terrae TaxID=2530383 RepID=A0A4R4Z804_9ACTN|nr:hypothetical protein [Nonomuraea terrae]TDD54076.1 hypothetical protein E1286_06090 [Nonomuraea terrae]
MTDLGGFTMRRVSRPLIVAALAGGLLALSAPAASANPDDHHPYRGGLHSGLDAGFGAAAGPGLGTGLAGGLTGGLGLR